MLIQNCLEKLERRLQKKAQENWQSMAYYVNKNYK